MINPAVVKNRLIGESSPYLLQHAEDPVDWWPWCEEAFAKAQREDRPLFVSVGYSACHWCHVMQRESFRDETVAALLNRSFVCVKVDREERPDVDAFLMRVCQVMTGSGGWPLSAFLTPDRRPFYAGTYFPKRSAHGRIGFVELLSAIAASWARDREALLESCARIIGAVKQTQHTTAAQMTPELMKRGFLDFADAYDARYGGFGRAPKFPAPHTLMFLMRYRAQTGDERALSMALHTLTCMARGGIHDLIGGGFCRYSTDRMWLTPHFEKMLYDNALLALAYVEAHLMTGEAMYKDVAARTLDYLLREMRSPRGGFFTAQDADSGGEEGAYYLFTRGEVIGALGREPGGRICAALNIAPGDEKSIPNLLHADWGGLEALGEELGALYRYRLGRMPLRTDDKVLTAWNALAIVALARASAAFGRLDHLDAALGALGFIEDELTDPQGRLFVSFSGGAAKDRGNLDDYAFICWALIALYDATLDGRYISRALALCAHMTEGFRDADGGYFLCEDNGELHVRPKESADGAMPCGNSVCGYVLERLAAYTGDARLAELAQLQANHLAGAAARDPSGHSFGLVSGMLGVYPRAELVCATDDLARADEFRAFLGRRFLPHVTAVLNMGEGDVPQWARGHRMLHGRTTYYVCRDCACSAPVHTLAQVEALL